MTERQKQIQVKRLRKLEDRCTRVWKVIEKLAEAADRAGISEEIDMTSPQQIMEAARLVLNRLGA